MNMLNHIFKNIKIYIKFFINKPINNANYNILIEHFDKILNESLKISYEFLDVKSIFLH